MSSRIIGVLPGPTPSFIKGSRAAHLGLVIGVCVLVFWVRLGHSGLASSEGFRAIPAWEVLRSGDWLVTRLFDQPYLRKPPGIVWAIALSSSVFGETEFAARLVSALAITLACLIVLIVGDRWFGKPRGVCAACAMALTPCFWMPGRSAEIESLHNSLVLVSGVLLVEMAVGRAGRSVGRSAMLGVGAGLAIGATLLTKGPAAVPFLGGLLAGACLSMRSARPVGRWGVWLAVAIGGALFLAWYRALLVRVDALEVEPVTETARFLWRPGKQLGVLALIPAALAGALPWSLALPFSLIRRSPSPEPERAETMGACAAWGMCVGLAAYALLGVDNARYAMPAITFLPFVYAHALWRQARAWGSVRTWGRRLCLGRPAIPVLGLLGLGIGYAQWQENWRGVRHSGEDAGLALAAALPPSSAIVADELIDTRPEVLWYARRAAQRRGDGLRVRWLPDLASRPWMAVREEYLAFRSDLDPRESGEPEWTVLQRCAGALPPPVYRGTAHKFAFTVFEPGTLRGVFPGENHP